MGNSPHGKQIKGMYWSGAALSTFDFAALERAKRKRQGAGDYGHTQLHSQDRSKYPRGISKASPTYHLIETDETYVRNPFTGQIVKRSTLERWRKNAVAQERTSG